MGKVIFITFVAAVVALLGYLYRILGKNKETQATESGHETKTDDLSKPMEDEQDKRQGERLCLICKKEEVFPKGDFDECLSCAIKERDRLHKEFIDALSPEQLVLFERYEKASEDVASMFILE